MTVAHKPTTLRLVDGRSSDYVEMPRSEIVGMLMDWQALTTEAIAAIEANGYTLQTVMHLLPGALRDEAMRGAIDTHDRLVAVLKELRMAAGRYDRPTP